MYSILDTDNLYINRLFEELHSRSSIPSSICYSRMTRLTVIMKKYVISKYKIINSYKTLAHNV